MPLPFYTMEVVESPYRTRHGENSAATYSEGFHPALRWRARDMGLMPGEIVKVTKRSDRNMVEHESVLLRVQIENGYMWFDERDTREDSRWISGYASRTPWWLSFWLRH